MRTGRPSPLEAPAVSLPAWVTVLDLTAVVLAALTLLVAVFGGFRVALDGTRLTVTSPLRLGTWVAVAVLVRHVAFRREALHRRVLRVAAAWWRAPALRGVLPVFLASRLAVVLAGYLAVAMVGPPPQGVGSRVSDNELLNLPYRWDAAWYLSIATGGYRWSGDPAHASNILFFPALPVAMRVVGLLLGDRPLLAGLIVALAAFLWGLTFVHRLARDQLDEDGAATAVALLAAYPFAIFFGVPYGESLVLLGIAGAWYHLEHDRPWRAAWFGLLLGLSKPNGWLLSAALAVIASRRVAGREGPGVRSHRRVIACVAAVASPVVGVLIYSAFVYTLTGDPLMWLRGQAAWGRTSVPLGAAALDSLRFIARFGLYDYTLAAPGEAMNAAAALFALVAIVPVARRFGLAAGLVIALYIVPPLMAGGVLSMGRFTSVLFPIFLWLAAVIPARQRPAWTIAFAIGQGLAAAMFFAWRPVF
jgi:hypothetical protein